MLSTDETIYYEFGAFRLDVARQQLLRDGKPLALTHKAFATLLILVKNAGQIVEKDDLMTQLWTDSFVEESNLSQYIYVLRKLLGVDPGGNPYIETITKRGFRFTAEVRELHADIHISNDILSTEIIGENYLDFPLHASENGFSSATAAAHRSFPPDDGAPRNLNQPARAEERSETPLTLLHPYKILPEKRLLRFRLLLVTVLCLGLISVAAYVYKNQQPFAASDYAGGKPKSIAVLPFKSIGEDTRNEKLGFGMADAIITRLGRTKQIPVRPTSAIFQFTEQPAGAAMDSIAVGRQLNVDAVLEGTIQRDGERVRVSVSLIRVSDGEVLWADKFDENFTDIFALQDSISSSVAKSLSMNLAAAMQEKKVPTHLQPPPTSQPEAYQAYLLGVYFWNKRTKEDLEKGATHFQRAIDLDPNYAQAYAGLADCYNLLGYYQFADRTETRAKSRAAAEKALALNESLAEAHIALAFTQPDMESARASLERALELAPYNSTARVRYGWNLLRADAPETLEPVEKQMRLAQEYDPLSVVSNGALCGVLMFRRKFGEALGYCRKSAELSPDSTQSRLNLSNALFFAGQHEEAIEMAKTEAEKGEQPDDALGTLGHYYAMLGRRAEAEKIYGELKLKAKKNPRLLLDLTLVGNALGRRDESLAFFKQAYEKKILPYALVFDPVWDGVVKDPEIKKLLK